MLGSAALSQLKNARRIGDNVFAGKIIIAQRNVQLKDARALQACPRSAGPRGSFRPCGRAGRAPFWLEYSTDSLIVHFTRRHGVPAGLSIAAVKALC